MTDLEIAITYIDEVAVDPDAALGDIWLRLDISFDNGFESGHILLFGQDTDNLKVSGDIAPDPRIPEPASLLLLAAVVGGIAATRRKR